jgi:hypothetical protein
LSQAAQNDSGNFDARQFEPDHFYSEACFKATTSDKIIVRSGELALARMVPGGAS